MAYNYGNFQPAGYQMPNYVQPQQMHQMQFQNQYSQAMPQQQQNQYVQAIPPQPQQNQPTGNAGFVWVQGEAGAKAYPVAAGNSVLLMDSEAPVLYMKSTDSSGRPLPIETYDLVKREAVSYQASQVLASKVTEIDLSEYVKASDLETMVNALIEKALGK